MKHLLVSLRSFGFIALTSLLVVMCSDERQETMGIEEDSSSTNSVYGPSGSGSASLPGTSQGADQTDYSTLEVVDTKVSVSEGNLALTADAISWVVKVECDFARLPDYPGSNVAYVVGTTGGDDELVRLYKGDTCDHSLEEININGVGCPASVSDDDNCGTIVSSDTGSLTSGNAVANNDTIGYTFQIVQKGKGIDISSAVQGQIESNIEQESSVSVAGIVAPSFSAGSDSFIKDDKAVLHIGLNPSPDFKVAEGASVSAKYNDSAVNAGKTSAGDISFSGTDCDNLSGCSGVACRYAAGYKYAGSSKDTSFSLKSGGIVCGGEGGLSLNQDGSAKSYEVTIEHAKGDHKSYQVITVDIACQPTPGQTCGN